MTVEAPPRPPQELFPSEDDYQKLLSKRTRRGRFVAGLFMFALVLAVLALASLLYTIINDSFGLVAVVNQTEPGGGGCLSGVRPDHDRSRRPFI